VTLLDRLLGRQSPTTSELVPVDEAPLGERVNQLSQQLRQEQETGMLLVEQISELESALNENGWDKLAASEPGTEFSRAGLQQIASLCRLTSIANPLVKRGVALRVGYVWGRGISVEARANGQDSGDQDVNAVVQDFWGDPSNKASWTGSQAREERERSLAVDGNIFAACFTSPLTGRVQLRTLPFDEIADVITNPEDRDEPWFYKRDWMVEDFDAQGRMTRTRHIAFYPALDVASGIPTGPGRRLRAKPRQITDIHGNTAQVQWDAPVLHVRVNALDGWKFGLPDVYAVLPWSRAYKEFLEDWAVLVKALSRYAYRISSKGSRVDKIATRIREAPSANSVTGKPNSVGGTAVTDDFTTLEAVPKTGATIDSESGRPLAAMVAAGLGVPVTMLLGDPGMTGARATAETLDRPTELEMGLRRELWAETERRLLDYAIDQAVIAPQGELKGTVKRDANGRDRVTLTGDTDDSMRTVDVAWPPLEDTPVDLLVKAIATADQTEKMPPLLTFKLLAQALDVEDIDELIDDLTDDDGNWIPLDVADNQARAQQADRGIGGGPVAVPNDGSQGNPNDPTNQQGQQNQPAGVAQ
jgi:hypothetical protein